MGMQTCLHPHFCIGKPQKALGSSRFGCQKSRQHINLSNVMGGVE